jgi:hypothetical protein
MVFIDGHHQEEPTLRYHEGARRIIHPRGIIVHDDIAWSAGMVRAWAKIREQERDCNVIELFQGDRPSRGILLYGDAKPPRYSKFHLDPFPERLLRKALHAIRRADGP